MWRHPAAVRSCVGRGVVATRVTNGSTQSLRSTRTYYTSRIPTLVLQRRRRRPLSYPPRIFPYNNNNNNNNNINNITVTTARSISSLSSSSLSAWGYVKDVIRSRSLTPTNPILDHVVARLRWNDHHATTTTTTPSSLPPLLRFSQIEPRHLVSAAAQALQDYREGLSSLLSSEEEKEEQDYLTFTSRVERLELPLRQVERLAGLLRSVGVPRPRDLDKPARQAQEMIWHDGRIVRLGLVPVWQQWQTQWMHEAENGSSSSSSTTMSDQIRKQRLEVLRGWLEQAQHSENDDDDDIVPRLWSLERSFARSSSSRRPLSARESVPLMYEILSLKRRLAQQQQQQQQQGGGDGTMSYTDFCWRHGRRGLRDPTRVRELHDAVSRRALPRAKRWAKEEAAPPALALPPLRLDRVLTGLFGLVERLFGVRVREETDQRVDAWHRDVRLFHLYDVVDSDGNVPTTTETLLGSFYFDPYSRPYKERGEWMGSLWDDDDGSSRSPVLLYLSCYVDPPVWDDDPIYLTWADVKGLFHEFGHVLHQALSSSKTKDGDGSFNQVEQDADEFSSQFMEHWLYDETVLASLLPPPDDDDNNVDVPQLLHDLQQRRRRDAALKFTVQTFLGQLELDLHDVDVDDDFSILDLQTRVAETYLVDVPRKGDFSHLTEIFRSNAGSGSGGGESPVSIYRYLWSDVLAVDAYQAFVGLNQQEQAALGRTFRRLLLVGSSNSGFTPTSTPTLDAFVAFRGREPSVDALFAAYGLDSDEEEET